MNFKNLVLAICFFALNAQAQVDYVAIGKLINQGKASMAETRAGVVCILNNYEADQTCANLEIANEKFKNVMADRIAGDYCGGFDAKSPTFIRYLTKNVRELAGSAKPDDAIWAVIEKYERSLDSLQAELEETYSRVKFNETYVSKCMFGLEPSPVTIKSLICE